jgi:hypothetical protein
VEYPGAPRGQDRHRCSASLRVTSTKIEPIKIKVLSTIVDDSQAPAFAKASAYAKATADKTAGQASLAYDV